MLDTSYAHGPTWFKAVMGLYRLNISGMDDVKGTLKFHQ